MMNIFLRLWIWLKCKFQNPVSKHEFGSGLSRSEKRYVNKYMQKYNGALSYKKVPSIM